MKPFKHAGMGWTGILLFTGASKYKFIVSVDFETAKFPATSNISES
jgi:hypothetical protein